MADQFTPVLIGGGPSQQSVYETSNVAKHRPGTRGVLPDGREFEYVRSDSGTAIGKNKLATYDPIVAAIDKISIQANTAAGSFTLPVTVTVTLLENKLYGATITLDESGEAYGINSHAAHTSGTLTLTLNRALAAAVTTSNRATINFGPCAVKISAGVTAQASPVEVAAGVPLVDIPISSGAITSTTPPTYFWVQKKGRACVLFGTVVGAVGSSIYHGEDAGSFQKSDMDHADTTDRDEKVSLGTTLALLPVDTEYHPVMLNIP